MHDFINYIVNIADQLGYLWIFLMMVLESSFIPFPSEVAMIPAWYLVALWKMNFLLAFIAGTSGALLWATINYFIAYKLWEKTIVRVIEKYWKFFFITKQHYLKAESYFLSHWVITVFLARFITVIRQLISLPAGAFKIDFRKFFFYTGIGAWLWNLWLMIIWYIAWENKELIKEYSLQMLIGWIIIIFIIWLVYFFSNRIKKDTV